MATQLLVSVSYVVKTRQRRDRTGLSTAGAQRPRTPRKLAALHPVIAAYAKQHPDATADEYRAWLQAEHGVVVSSGLMWDTLDRLG